MNSDLWQFGEFQLDVTRKILWHREQAVAMPLKELEVLSMLVRNAGHLVTKDELVDEIWGESFVEESNLSRHIYLLRKTLKDLGAEGTLIENVPRRGYRFAGEARSVKAEELVVEKHTQTRTLVEYQEETLPDPRISWRRPAFVLAGAGAMVILLVAGFFGYQLASSNGNQQQITSIAVLRFKTIGSSTTSEHSGAGLADILTTRLSRIRDLKVRPSGAVQGLNNLDSVAAAQKLGVDAVLDGTIYYAGDKVRVTARLVSASDGTIIWSGEFEKMPQDEMLLQNDIAMRIVPALAVNLSSGEREEIAKRYTGNSEAYDLYLRGRYEWNKRSTPGMIEAQRLFRNAIEADPNFALAYVGLADTLLTNKPYQNEALAVVTKAIELDPSLSEAHASRGFYLMFYDWNWSEAEAAFQRSIELNPNYPTAHHWYATLLSIKGDTDAAKAQLEQALDLNPTSHNFLADLGQLYYFSGDYAQAEAYCLRALEIYPDFTFAHEYLHYIYLKTGQHERSVLALAKADKINGRVDNIQAGGATLAEEHREVFLRSGMIGYYEFRYPGASIDPPSYYFYAIRHAIKGENEKALDYLEKSADARMFLVVFAKANPLFESLHGEPRYQNVLRKMGLG